MRAATEWHPAEMVQLALNCRDAGGRGGIEPATFRCVRWSGRRAVCNQTCWISSSGWARALGPTGRARDGQWRSSRQWVDEYAQSRYKRRG